MKFSFLSSDILIGLKGGIRMSKSARLDLSNNRKFRSSALRLAQHELQKHFKDLSKINMQDIRREEANLRKYPNLDSLRLEPKKGEIIEVTKQSVGQDEIEQAIQVKLAGMDLVENAAAGEATRLGIGTKYLLTPESLAKTVAMHNLKISDPKDFIPLPVKPQDLLPISVGNRHMLQLAFDLTELAAKNDLNPGEVLKSQYMLTPLNESTQLQIIRDFVKPDFFGFTPERMLFTVQPSLPGMGIKNGKLFYDPKSAHRLWNHGHMVMQETMDREIFSVAFDSRSGEIKRRPLSRDEFGTILKSMRNKISYPIEDIDFLTGSFNPINLALALKLGAQGSRMVMEVVGQKKPPQKGGFWAYDPALKRAVMIESDQAGKTPVENIKILNKNFNMFPEPYEVWEILGKEGLPPHLTVKGDHLYLQPPQGDQNFLVPTAFIRWEPVQPIRNLKNLTDAPATLSAMEKQDAQYGFKDFARRFGLV